MSDDLKLVKELRDKTGAGFLDCKEALANNDGNLDNAIDYLRKKGLAKASKKSSREANEGAVGFFENNNIGVIIKVNSETDFAAKGDTFLDFIDFLFLFLFIILPLQPMQASFMPKKNYDDLRLCFSFYSLGINDNL